MTVLKAWDVYPHRDVVIWLQAALLVLMIYIFPLHLAYSDREERKVSPSWRFFVDIPLPVYTIAACIAALQAWANGRLSTPLYTPYRTIPLALVLLAIPLLLAAWIVDWSFPEQTGSLWLLGCILFLFTVVSVHYARWWFVNRNSDLYALRNALAVGSRQLSAPAPPNRLVHRRAFAALLASLASAVTIALTPPVGVDPPPSAYEVWPAASKLTVAFTLAYGGHIAAILDLAHLADRPGSSGAPSVTPGMQSLLAAIPLVPAAMYTLNTCLDRSGQSNTCRRAAAAWAAITFVGMAWCGWRIAVDRTGSGYVSLEHGDGEDGRMEEQLVIPGPAELPPLTVIGPSVATTTGPYALLTPDAKTPEVDTRASKAYHNLATWELTFFILLLLTLTHPRHPWHWLLLALAVPLSFVTPILSFVQWLDRRYFGAPADDTPTDWLQVLLHIAARLAVVAALEAAWLVELPLWLCLILGGGVVAAFKGCVDAAFALKEVQ